MKKKWKKLMAGFVCGMVICTNAGLEQVVCAQEVEDVPVLEEAEDIPVPEEIQEGETVDASETANMNENVNEDESEDEDGTAEDDNQKPEEDEEAETVEGKSQTDEENNTSDNGSENNGSIPENNSEENFICSGNYKLDPSLLDNLKKIDQELNGDLTEHKAQPKQNKVLGAGLCPSEGNVHSLVLMVDFSDVTFSDNFTKEYVEQIMFGEPDDMSNRYPKESVNAWYQRSSYGKLSFYGEVIELSLEHTREYYTYSEDTEIDEEMYFWDEIWETLKNMEVDWSEYDINKDNYLDSICVIAAGEQGDWAEQWWSQVRFGRIPINDTYAVRTYGLFMEGQMSGPSTAIHEFGHCLGLPDLYNTSDKYKQAAYGINTSDMMNSNSGDFNALCKMLLGWIDANQIQLIKQGEEAGVVTLDSYTKTGACALLFLNSGDTSIFNEYYLIQYMDFYGNDKELQWEVKNEQLRIYHVNAELNETGNALLHDNRISGDCKLIEVVDKDAEYMHATKYSSIMDPMAFVWGQIWGSDYYRCGYFSGDEFTPYTAPSSAKYAEDRLAYSPDIYSGLYVTDIVFTDGKAFFNVLYENKPAETESLKFVSLENTMGCSANNLKFQVVSNHDIWLTDKNKSAYIRKKGEEEAVAAVFLQMPEEAFYFGGHYSFNVKVDDSIILEDATEYEVVFPEEMFITSYGVYSEEVIISGIKTEINLWDTNQINTDLNSDKYARTSDDFVLNNNYNIEIAAKGVDGSIYICELDRNTGGLLNESLIVQENSSGSVGYIRSFGKSQNGDYWITADSCSEMNAMDLYILNSDKDLIYSNTKMKERPDGVIPLENNKLALGNFAYGKNSFSGYIFDLEKLELNKLQPAIGVEYAKIFKMGDYLLISEYADYGSYGQRDIIYYISDYNGNIIKKLELELLSIEEVIVSTEGYDIYGNLEDKVIKYQLCSDFLIKSRMILAEGYNLIDVYRLNTGYLMDWREEGDRVDPDKRHKYTLVDNHYNLYTNMSIPYVDHCVHILMDNNEYFASARGFFNSFSCQISRAINIPEGDKNDLEKLTVSQVIQLDDNGYVILGDGENLTDFVNRISPVNNEIYSISKENGNQYLKVSKADKKAEKYFKILNEMYMVTFDLQGITSTTGEYLEYKDVPGASTIEAPTPPEAEGYIFTGWYKDENCTILWDFEKDTVEDDVVLYAGWEKEEEPPAETYTVIFALQGHGTENPAYTGIQKYATIEKPADPEASGYTFTGWYKDAACMEAWNFATDIIEGDTTLYAGWMKNEESPVETYTVTFALQGHGKEIPAYTGIQKYATIEKPADPEASGYTFTGWYKDAACMETWDFAMDMIEGDMILFAGWEKEEEPPAETYTVTFALQGHGAEIPAYMGIQKYATIEKPVDPEASGYTFTGWYKDAVCMEAWNFATDIIERDTTLYAGWMKSEEPSIETYTVTFDLQGHGIEIPAYSGVQKDVRIEKPTDPEAFGYTFTGWYKDVACSIEWSFDTDTVSGDITLYAGWMKNKEPQDLGDVLPEDVPADEKIPEKQIWIVPIQDTTYTGKAIKPEVHIYWGKERLDEGVDYTLKYRNNTQANGGSVLNKTPQIVVKYKKHFTEKQQETIYFKIQPVNLADVTADDLTLAVSKKVQKKAPIVTWLGKKLVKGKDFDVSYPDEGKSGAYQEKGEYTVLLTAGKSGNFTGSKTVRLTVTDLIPVSKVSAKVKRQPYDKGKPVEPELKVTYKGKALEKDVDYTVSYQNNTEIGTASALITGAGKYQGTKKVTFKITGMSIKKAVVAGLTSTEYTGATQTPDNFTVTLGGSLLKQGEDYDVSFSKSRNAGKGDVIISGIGQYTGTLKKTFKITAYDLKQDESKNENRQIKGLEEDISVSLSEYTKSICKPEPVLTFRGRVLRKGRDYTISYKNNKKAAAATAQKAPMIVIKGKGNFKGTVQKAFTITE